MRRMDAKMIIDYYFGIPMMKKLLDSERVELENEYNGLRGMSYDSAPYNHMPGKPTEGLVEKLDVQNVRGRLDEIRVLRCVLDTDREKIQGCLDTLKGEYKKMVMLRYGSKYSWAKIAVYMSTTERTAKRWHDRTLDRLGEVLEDVPMAEELIGRASRARV